MLISEKLLTQAKKGDKIVVNGNVQYLAGVAILDPQEQATGAKAWNQRFGSEKTALFWTGTQVVSFIPSFEGDGKNDWMCFDQVEPDSELIAELGAKAKEFGGMGQPRWKVSLVIHGETYFVADIATVSGVTPTENEGIMRGSIAARYVLLETKAEKHILYVMGQKVPMSGIINPTLLVNGATVDVEDYIQMEE